MINGNDCDPDFGVFERPEVAEIGYHMTAAPPLGGCRDGFSDGDGWRKHTLFTLIDNDKILFPTSTFRSDETNHNLLRHEESINII